MSFSKAWIVSVLLMMLLTAVFGSAQFPVTIQDHTGQTFRFDRSPSRIVSLNPGHTETLFALGAGGRVIGVDAYSDFPVEARSKPKIGGAHSHNLEQIVALQPDLVIALADTDDLFHILNAHGIRALKIYPTNFQSLLESISLLGEITGTSDRAHELINTMKQRVDRVHTRVQALRAPRVFLELDATNSSQPITVGPNGLIGEMIQFAGGLNIAQKIPTDSGRLSLEAVIAADPEILILADANTPMNPQNKEAVYRRSAWSGIAAVRNQAIYPVDYSLFFRWGPRVVEGIETLARIFHPDAFSVELTGKRKN